MSSKAREMGSAVTPHMCVCNGALFIGEAEVASLSETGNTGASRKSLTLSVESMLRVKSCDLSTCVLRGGKRGGVGSAVELSVDKASHETGTAAVVEVAFVHCVQSVPKFRSQGRHDNASLFP